MGFNSGFKVLNAELNPICHLLAFLGAHHILHISRVRVNTRSAGQETLASDEPSGYVCVYMRL